MNKQSSLRRTVKIALLIIISLVILIALAVYGFIWYNFYDTSSLILYKDEVIEDILVHHDKVYLITDDGKGYVAGGYSDYKNREYSNSQSTKNRRLNGNPAPVLFFDGVINNIFRCEDGSIMFSDNENNLYILEVINETKIAEKIISAAKSSVSDDIYAIDETHNLFILGKNEILLSGVSVVKACEDKVFVLLDNGYLCKYINGVLSDPVFTNVKSFDVVDTSKLIYNGEDVILNDAHTAENPLINVLTFDGELYAKGTYNVTYMTQSTFKDYPLPHRIDEWTLIGQNVTHFSLAGMGTVMVFDDKTCAYYGFDTSYNKDSKIQYKSFEFQGVETVCATNWHISIKASDGYYFLGNKFKLFFGRMSDEHNILTGTPYKIDR